MIATAKFKKHNFKVVKEVTHVDGTKELALQGARHSAYIATIKPGDLKWRLEYQYPPYNVAKFIPINEVSFVYA